MKEWNPYEVIIKPVVTEKAMYLAEEGKYTFEVASWATKIDVKRALNEIFKVEVDKVNVIKTRGKIRTRWVRGKRVVGKEPDRKKVVVTLKPGYSLPKFFEPT